jgi:hypothetical protein
LLAIGLLCLALGTAAVVVGVPWTWLEEGGWPWSGSISYDVGSGYVEATILHPDGRVEVFQAATEGEALAWVQRRNEELKDVYHLDEKIAAGRVLGPLGFGLIAVGGGVLVWRLVKTVGRRRSGNGMAAPV